MKGEIKIFSGGIELLNVEDLAKKMDVHIVTIRRYIRTGELKARRIGRRYWVSKERFREFVEK